MKQTRILAAAVLAVLLVASLGFLPHGIALVEDWMTTGKTGSASMKTIRLDIAENGPAGPNAMLQKLALEQRMTASPVKPTLASMTEAEVLAAAEAGLEVYMESGLLGWFDSCSCTAEPRLGMDPEKDNSGVFWVVTFVSYTDPYHLLVLHIDDETGMILYIRYEMEGADREICEPERLLSMMEAFSHNFLSALNLVDPDAYDNLLSVQVREPRVSDGVASARYSYEDAHWGMIHVEFYIIPSGFYVYFPL